MDLRTEVLHSNRIVQLKARPNHKLKSKAFTWHIARWWMSANDRRHLHNEELRHHYLVSFCVSALRVGPATGAGDVTLTSSAGVICLPASSSSLSSSWSSSSSSTSLSSWSIILFAVSSTKFLKQARSLFNVHFSALLPRPSLHREILIAAAQYNQVQQCHPGSNNWTELQLSCECSN